MNRKITIKVKIMGTKKGQERKTARRAYMKPTRNQKVRAAQQFRMLSKLGNGRRRDANDLMDSYMETLRRIVREY
tara:strand:- start:634 stop:858 length:225 start_codon:yes stop_codon:yes gene_type:complete